jgi:hypothetical protein
LEGYATHAIAQDISAVDLQVTEEIRHIASHTL